MGHIKWRQAISRDSGYLKPTSGAPSTCTVDDFMNGSWKADAGRMIAKARRWVDITQSHEFGSPTRNIKSPSGVKIAQDLSDIYYNGMTTVLGDLNAIEDFAETYAIQVIIMATSKVQYQLNINFNPSSISSINVLNTSRNSDLSAKAECVQPLLQ